MSVSPGVILTCQFTLPSKKSFGQYIDYVTRESALNDIEKRTPEEECELILIQSGINNIDLRPGEKVLDLPNNLSQEDTVQEAKVLLKDGLDFERMESEGFTKYLSYMTRQTALESKNKLTSTEAKELVLLSDTIESYKKNTHEKASGILPGVFSMDSERLTVDELGHVKNKFEHGQRRGSVIYQDVISHDNAYLETLGLYDSKSDELDEKGLVAAGNKMMADLFERENMQDTGMWMASIHRNTKHIHIHFAIVEKENTRPLFTNDSDSLGSVLPKGKRKQSTLDSMKTSYVHELERYAGNKNMDVTLVKKQLLTRKSDLRNSLTQQVKQHSQYDDTAIELLKNLHMTLPDKRADWNYGTENKTKLSTEARTTLNNLTKHLLTQTPEYKEYVAISKTLKDEALRVYGESHQESKQVDKNALFDLQKRTGNAILTSLKQQDSELKQLLIDQATLKISKNNSQLRAVSIENETDGKTSQMNNHNDKKGYSKVRFNGETSKKLVISRENLQIIRDQSKLKHGTYSDFKKRQAKQRQSYMTRKSLYQIKKTVNQSEEKYQAMMVYEEQQRRIQMEQYR